MTGDDKSASAVTLPAVNDQLTSIDRIIDVTGWRQEPEDRVGWEQVEAELGVALPSDFKELCRPFVPGAFYAQTFYGRPTITRSAASCGSVAGDVPVDCAEGRGGEGGEDDRVPAHRGGDTLAAGQAAAHDLVGVAPVDLPQLGCADDCPRPTTRTDPAGRSAQILCARTSRLEFGWLKVAASGASRGRRGQPGAR